jgi:2-desacetyl-2-hydroxyethyl bacteriochlorophyllide A dehydrogenase
LRAALLAEDPWSLRVVDDWPEPQADSGQVVVAVRGVGVCGSDLALLSGHWRPPYRPWIPGHEAFGEIVAAGRGVGPERIGQRVAIEPNIPCSACPACRSGLTSACPDRRSLGFSAPGTLAEKIAVPAEFAWEVPSDWSDEDAVCTEPLTVALAAIRRSGVSGFADGVRCLVVGAGSQGAMLCAGLVASGLRPRVIEPHAGRRALATSLGAAVAGADDGAFDVVFETSGTSAALADAVERTAAGGTVVLIGLAGESAPLATEVVVRRQLRIQGSLTYDHPGDFATVIKRNLRPGRVLRACYPLAEAERAFRSAQEVPGKTWIRLSERVLVREVGQDGDQAVVVGGHAGFGAAQAVEQDETGAVAELLVAQPGLAHSRQVEAARDGQA